MDLRLLVSHEQTVFFGKMGAVVGAYASDYGFLLPNPVSIRRERFWPRLGTERRIVAIKS